MKEKEIERLLKLPDDYGRKINLYHTGKFYVEVYYNPKANAIVKFRAFKSTRCLEPYLESIEI